MNTQLPIAGDGALHEDALIRPEAFAAGVEREHCSDQAAVDELMHDLLRSMKSLSTDEHRRKEVARLLV
jgi:hypothetical protein